jgi:hypothetical protein
LRPEQHRQQPAARAPAPSFHKPPARPEAVVATLARTGLGCRISTNQTAPGTHLTGYIAPPATLTRQGCVMLHSNEQEGEKTEKSGGLLAGTRPACQGLLMECEKLMIMGLCRNLAAGKRRTDIRAGWAWQSDNASGAGQPLFPRCWAGRPWLWPD